MTQANEHRERSRRQDARMPEALRNVLSQLETLAEAKGRQRANQLRRIIRQLRTLDDALWNESDQESYEARRYVYAAIGQLLIAAHHLEGNSLIMPAPAKLPDGYYVIRDEDDMHRVYRREGDSWVPVPGIRPYKRRVQAVAAAWKHAGYALPWQRVGEESTDI